VRNGRRGGLSVLSGGLPGPDDRFAEKPFLLRRRRRSEAGRLRRLSMYGGALAVQLRSDDRLLLRGRRL
jgi:hypothetical protein